MSGPIQTIPRGLLSFLQLKQMGRNPAELGEQVVPQLQLLDFYLQGQMVDQRNIGTISTVGSVQASCAARGLVDFTNGTDTLTTASNEMWYVEAFSGVGNIPAAETLRCQLVKHCNPAVCSVAVSPDVSDIITARARAFQISSLVPFWVGPGYTLGVEVFDVLTGTAINLVGSLRFVSIKF